MPDEFRAVVTRAAQDYLPRKREVGALGRYVDNHVECLQAAISLEFEDCHVKAKVTQDDIRITIDLSTSDTGFAYIVLPITYESDTLYVGGVS